MQLRISISQVRPSVGPSLIARKNYRFDNRFPSAQVTAANLYGHYWILVDVVEQHGVDGDDGAHRPLHPQHTQGRRRRRPPR